MKRTLVGLVVVLLVVAVTGIFAQTPPTFAANRPSGTQIHPCAVQADAVAQMAYNNCRARGTSSNVCAAVAAREGRDRYQVCMTYGPVVGDSPAIIVDTQTTGQAKIVP